MQRRSRTQRSRAARAAAMPLARSARAYVLEAAGEPDPSDADSTYGGDASDAPAGEPDAALPDEPDGGPGEPGGEDDGAVAEPPLWQTSDGHVLHLPPHILDSLILRARGRGRRPRPQRPRRRARRPPRPARRALLRRIGQLARGAQRVGSLRHRPTGRRLPVFRAGSRGRGYRIVARPRRGLRHEILLVRPVSLPLSEQGETGRAVGRDRAMAHAVERNRDWARRLGWDRVRDRIAQLVGFTNMSPTEQAFAEAVMLWQRRHGLKADGIVGPKTWKRMRAQLTAGAAGDPAVAPPGAGAKTAGISPAVVQRIRRFDSLIERVAAAEGVNPNLIRAVMAAESGGDPNTTAPSGYKGLMQAARTADQYDPETSIRTGARKLKDFQRSIHRSLRESGIDPSSLSPHTELHLLAAAYNAGPATVRQALRYAARAGDARRWLDAEHFQRALIYYSSYSVRTALPSYLRGLSGQQLAEALAALPETPGGSTTSLAEIRRRHQRNGRWDEAALRKEIIRRVTEESVYLSPALVKKRGRNPLGVPPEGFTLAEVRRRASPWLLRAVEFKHTRLRDQAYGGKIIRYFRHFESAAERGGRSAAPGSAIAEELAASRVATAVRQNRRYAQRLEWAPHRRRILQLFGYDRYTPDAPEDVFARAVAAWQQRNGLAADGVIGPNTWRHLQRAISEPILSRVPPPERFQPAPLSRPGGGRVPLDERRDPAPDDILWVPHANGRNMVPLHQAAARALTVLQKAARADGIRPPLLRPTSGYRSSARQRMLWERALKKYGSAQAARKWVAPPGSSSHQSGRAVDFYLGRKNSSGNVARLRTLPAYRWLVRNAVRFGFYPYDAEPWHWEYNPPAPGANELEVLLAESLEEEVGC